MQKITIEVKDDYVNNIMSVLQGLKGVIVDKIKFDDSMYINSTDENIIKLQQDSMSITWENDEDKAWDEL
jgi:translation elongation factor EF-G